MDLRIEIFREFSTLVMLILVSLFAFTQRIKRWAAFFFTWGVRDIFYYVWLKILIRWPAHWTDWGILVLIPVPWVAPFITPVMMAFFFMLGGLLIILKNVEKLKEGYLLLALIGAVLIFFSFIWRVIFTKVDALYITQGEFPWASLYSRSHFDSRGIYTGVQKIGVNCSFYAHKSFSHL